MTNERRNLPVLPLRETVIFPGVAVPISAGRPGTVAAIQTALDGDRMMFAVCQRENEDEPTAQSLYQVGVVVHVVQAQRGRGGLQLLLEAESRALTLAYSRGRDGMLEATVRVLEEPEVDPIVASDPTFSVLNRQLRDRAAELARRRGIPSDALKQLLDGVPSAGGFADLVAFYLDLPSSEKQVLLELFPVEERVRRVLVEVERELVRVDAQEDIQEKVQQELGDKQREMLLREQLKVIHRELGEDEEAGEVDELKERIRALELPESAKTEVERELSRLERTHPQSAEYQVIRTYLESVAELPWSERTEDRLDLGTADRILGEDHYGLEDVKDRVLEFLAVRKLQMERAGEAPEAEAGAQEEAQAGSAVEVEPGAMAGAGNDPQSGLERDAPVDPSASGESESPIEADGTQEERPSEDPTGEAVRSERAKAVGRGPILLFVGPPGVGKTSIAQSVARALGRKYVRIALGGARDEADIRGHRRTYVGAMPGRIIQGMKQAGTKNPVFLLDEVDKLGVSMQGDPASALLEVLDPAQNHSFIDHYLGIPFDLSEVLFIATANWRDQIPAPLLDRMDMVEFSGYTEQEKLEIARRYLLPRQREGSGLDEEQLEVTDAAVRRTTSAYTRESGVRQLERELGKLARKAARRIAGGEVSRVVIDEEDVQSLLGRPRVHPERAAAEDAIGVATGMYYSPMGGDIMFVEASVSRGKESLILTGQLGDVMKESARAALTYARTHHDRLGIPEESLQDMEIHIHVPAGAIPKDGPSAGITMATALVSSLSGRTVRHDVAMTGEITLSGRVLGIGGLKEKVLGAHRAGIREVVLPRQNEMDLDDLPDDVRDELTFHVVDTLGEVLALALRGASLHEGFLKFPDPALVAKPSPAGSFPGPMMNCER